MNDNAQHLKLLSIFYYIYAALSAVGGCFPIIYLLIGIVMLVAPDSFDDDDPPPEVVAWMLIIFACLGIALLWTAAICMVVVGRSLTHRRRYVFIMVVAGLICLQVPIGTVLGVFTFLVLLRPEVKEMFYDTGMLPGALEPRDT
jgi:hypothetical protein